MCWNCPTTFNESLTLGGRSTGNYPTGKVLFKDMVSGPHWRRFIFSTIGKIAPEDGQVNGKGWSSLLGITFTVKVGAVLSTVGGMSIKHSS